VSDRPAKTATLWEFRRLRASLHQCHIHKLSKVGKDRAAWAKADEYLTDLIDSDTMLTLENTDDVIKRTENYLQRQDIEGTSARLSPAPLTRRTLSMRSIVKALGAALKEKEKRLEEKVQRLSALEAKFGSFSHEPRDGNKTEEADEEGVRLLQEDWQVGSRPRRICMLTQAGRRSRHKASGHQGEACRKGSPGDHE